MGTRRVELAADAAYCNDTVTRDMPATVVLFGAMRPDAVLTALPEPRKAGTRGRTSQRGAPLPEPHDLAKDAAHPWQRCKAMLYGRLTEVRYKTLDAQWYRACGTRLLRTVLVATDRGTIGGSGGHSGGAAHRFWPGGREPYVWGEWSAAASPM